MNSQYAIAFDICAKFAWKVADLTDDKQAEAFIAEWRRLNASVPEVDDVEELSEDQLATLWAAQLLLHNAQCLGHEAD